MSLTKTRLYLDGVVPARALLCCMHNVMHNPGHCWPGRLREQLTYLSEHAYPLAFVKGFIDAVDAYLSMSFGGSDVDPRTRKVLAVIECRRVSVVQEQLDTPPRRAGMPVPRRNAMEGAAVCWALIFEKDTAGAVLKLDYIAVVAQPLEQAQAYASQRFGVELPADGKHPLMGTHNLAMRITSGVFLEFIVIDLETAAPNRARWFMFNRLTREGILEQAPRLFGWVASVPDLARNVGELLQHESLEVTHDDLRWHFFQCSDDEAEAGGCWPVLIDWTGGQDPVGRIQEVGLRLNQFQPAHPKTPAIRAKLQGLGWNASEPENRYVELSKVARSVLMFMSDMPNGLTQIEGGGPQPLAMC